MAEPGVAAGEPAAIDPEQLAELRELGTGPDGALAGIIRMFLADAPVTIADLSAAVSRSDAAAVGSLAHSLKGMASALGATSLAEVAASLVDQARTDQFGDAAVDRLWSEFDRARSALDGVLAETR